MIVKNLSNSFNPYPKSETKIKKKPTQIKKKTTKLAKKERNRTSILQKSKKCFICNSENNLTIHEVFGGSKRQKSMEYGLVVYLCITCHRKVEDDENMKKQLKLFAQGKFNMNYDNETFIKEFGKSYLKD